ERENLRNIGRSSRANERVHASILDGAHLGADRALLAAESGWRHPRQDELGSWLPKKHGGCSGPVENRKSESGAALHILTCALVLSSRFDLPWSLLIGKRP